MIQQYVTLVSSLARTKKLADIPAAISGSEWLNRSFRSVLSFSPSVGAFSDYVVSEDASEADYSREVWEALSPNIAWYAIYMDVLVNRRLHDDFA